nr:hypothetical protein [uncultured Devosia sp.]
MTATASTTMSPHSLPGIVGRIGSDKTIATWLPALAMAGAVLATGCQVVGIGAGSVAPHQPFRISIFQSQREGASAQESVADGILGDLGRLVDGWNGQGTVAPSAAVQADVADVLSVINLAEAPEVHVDDDGVTSLIWMVDERLASLEFFGNGKVVCTIADPDPAESWSKKYDVTDDVGIVGSLELAGVLA